MIPTTIPPRDVLYLIHLGAEQAKIIASGADGNDAIFGLSTEVSDFYHSEWLTKCDLQDGTDEEIAVQARESLDIIIKYLYDTVEHDD